MKRIFTLIIALASVFSLTLNAANVVFNVTVPTPTYQCWIVGNFNGWNNNDKQMTKVDDTHFTITLDDATFADDNGVKVTTATLKYKYLSGGGDWAYVEKDAAGTELNDRTYVKGTTIANPDPAKTTIPGNDGNDVVQSWAMTYNPNVAALPKDVLIEAYVAKTVTELYVTGTFNGWKSPGAEGTKMTLSTTESDANGNFFSLTIHTDDANKLAYKFSSGPSWSYEQTAGDFKMADPSLNSVYHTNLTFKRTYPGAANLKTVTMNVTVPAGTDACYMMGSHLGWDGSSWAAGTKNTNGTFTFSVPNIDFMEYKYYNGQGWSFEEKQADGTGLTGNRSADAQIALIFNDVVARWFNTGINQINLDNVKVFSANQQIIVDGVVANAQIFDVTGRNIQSATTSGLFASKVLNSGVYILKVDGATMKVVVK